MKDMLDLISHADGETSLLEIADRCQRPIWAFLGHLAALVAAGVVEKRP